LRVGARDEIAQALPGSLCIVAGSFEHCRNGGCRFPELDREFGKSLLCSARTFEVLYDPSPVVQGTGRPRGGLSVAGVGAHALQRGAQAIGQCLLGDRERKQR
jgi:hypothetical protein